MLRSNNVIIEEEINVPPRLFQVDKLRENVLDYLNATKNYKYDKYNDRLIKRVISIIDIYDSRISMADSTIWLSVKYVAEIINVDIDGTTVVCGGKVLAVIDDGLFVQFDGFKVLCVGGRKINSDVYAFAPCGCTYKRGGGGNDRNVKLIITAKDSKDDVLYCVGKHIC